MCIIDGITDNMVYHSPVSHMFPLPLSVLPGSHIHEPSSVEATNVSLQVHISVSLSQ